MRLLRVFAISAALFGFVAWLLVGRGRGGLAGSQFLNRPVPVRFTALDGRKVDLGEMAGKVVLVDFWATWCGPCLGELPRVKEAYQTYHPDGFEIVGISFDEDKSRLEGFLRDNGMSWPQYFDGEGWNNTVGRQFGIQGIPTMWLVDKKGILRDINARENLAEKVSKMLKE